MKLIVEGWREKKERRKRGRETEIERDRKRETGSKRMRDLCVWT